MSEREPRITREELYGDSIVCIHIMGRVLAMSPAQYDQSRISGKLWRRQQANTARKAKAQAREEAAQLQWIEE